MQPPKRDLGGFVQLPPIPLAPTESRGRHHNLLLDELLQLAQQTGRALRIRVV